MNENLKVLSDIEKSEIVICCKCDGNGCAYCNETGRLIRKSKIQVFSYNNEKVDTSTTVLVSEDKEWQRK